MTRKLIIGKVVYDVIKYKSHLRENQWANFIPSSIKINMDVEDYLSLKYIVEKFEGDFNFELIEDGGVYSCNGKLDNMIITSRFPNGDVICKMDILIFGKNKLEISESRNTILDDILNV